ncbi:MAG: hypothetical protein WD342_08775 [Verrucomicrobiales bacterium]
MKSTGSRTLPLIAAIAVATGGLFASQAKAASYNRLVTLAHQLDDSVGHLREEFKLHYRHTPQYKHLLSDATSMTRKVAHIDQLSYDPHVSLRHLQSDVEDLDDLAHHLQDLVAATERGRRGHVHGNTRHVQDLMASIMVSIHGLSEEIRVLQRPVHHGYPNDSHGNSQHDSHGDRDSGSHQLTDRDRHEIGRRYGSGGLSFKRGNKASFGPEAIRQWLFR